MSVHVKDFGNAKDRPGDVLNHAVLKKMLKRDARMKRDVGNARKKENNLSL